jgi:hypothetical protein
MAILSFGLKNALAKFQQVMDRMLIGFSLLDVTLMILSYLT